MKALLLHPPIAQGIVGGVMGVTPYLSLSMLT